MKISITIQIDSLLELPQAIREVKDDVLFSLAQEYLEEEKTEELSSTLQYSEVNISEFTQKDLEDAYEYEGSIRS